MEDTQNRIRRIAVVLASLDVGGAETRMIDILKSIDRSVFQMDFIILSKENHCFYEEEVRALGANIIYLDAPKNVPLKEHYRQMKQAFLDGKYDAVHANTSYHCGIVLRAAYAAKIPIRIAHARTNELRKSSMKKKFIAWIGKMQTRRFATDRLAISTESGEFLYGKRRKFLILPNAIRISAFSDPTRDQVDKVRREFEIDDDLTVIGHVGRFDKAKNQSFLIRVFAVYHQKNPRSMLVLIGDGSMRTDCEKMVFDLGLSGSVLFLGRRKDVPLWMNIFDIFIFPSLYEGLGNVAVEAQAAGIPCLCSDRIPCAVDMSLGLTEFLPLDAGEEVWMEKITEMMKIPHPDSPAIQRAFEAKQYTLNAAVKTLSEIYSK